MTTIDLYYHIRISGYFTSYHHFLIYYKYIDTLMPTHYYLAYYTMVPIQYLLSASHSLVKGSSASLSFTGQIWPRTSSAVFRKHPMVFWGISHDKVPWNRMVCPGVPAISHNRVLNFEAFLYTITIYSQFSIFFCLWKVRLQVLLLAGFSSLRLIPVWSWYMCYHMVPLLTGCLENLENPSTLPIPACTNENKREQ